MSKKWGVPTWVFLHTLAEKIKDEEYKNIRDDLLKQLKSICSVLPCPDCRDDAVKFMRPYTIKHIPSKNDFKELLWRFHNHVNVKTRKAPLDKKVLDIYKNLNISILFKVFVTELTRPIHNNQYAESMARTTAINNFTRFLNNNKHRISI